MIEPSTVTAVIPVHNGEAYVADAIESALNQSRPPVECLVVDDGSTDATAELVLSFGKNVAYVRQDCRGVSEARNRGAELARGEFVAFLDHDDQWLFTKLERQVEALAETNAAIALCGVNVVDRDGSLLERKRMHVRDDLITGMMMFDGTETVSCSSAGLVRRSAFRASGGFDPALSMSADWDLLLRMLLDDAIAYVDEPLAVYRVHADNMSRNIFALEQDMTRAFAKAFSNPRLPETVRRQRARSYGRLYRMLAGSYWEKREYRAALRAMTTSLKHDPRVAIELGPRIRDLAARQHQT